MPFTQYEITPGDWRKLEKWDAYRIAVSDMADRTSTERLAWTLIEVKARSTSVKDPAHAVRADRSGADVS
jgi:polyphosphate kinase 2 (PPK2 family)